MQEATSLAKMVNMEKNFGAVQALKKVNVEVRSGEILGLLRFDLEKSWVF